MVRLSVMDVRMPRVACAITWVTCTVPPTLLDSAAVRLNEQAAHRRARVSKLASALALVAMTSTLLVGPGCARGLRDEIYVPPYQPIWKGQNKLPTYRVGLPGVGWETMAGEELQVAWYHSTDSAVIQVRGECEEHGDSDLADFTDHQRIDYSSWEIIEEPTGEVDAEGRPRTGSKQYYTTIAEREALRTTVQARLDGVEVMIEFVVLKKDGCLFDLTYIAVPADFGQHAQAFEQVIMGFAYPARR